MMSHTFQCLLYCLLPDHPQSRILIAACGPYILTFDAPHGLLLSTWPVITGTGLPRNENFNIGSGGEVIRSGYSDQEFSERPQKRHKVYRSNEDFDSTSAEIVVGDTGEDKDVSSLRQVPNPPVIKLAGTSTGQHIIAVTGEDKCVRVFKLSPNGVLNLLSQR